VHPAERESGNYHAVHALGYQTAMRDVITVLDSRWLPEGEPVNFAAEPVRVQDGPPRLFREYSKITRWAVLAWVQTAG
jgi:hypothetical protein